MPGAARHKIPAHQPTTSMQLPGPRNTPFSIASVNLPVWGVRLADLVEHPDLQLAKEAAVVAVMRDRPSTRDLPKEVDGTVASGDRGPWRPPLGGLKAPDGVYHRRL